MWFSTVLVTLCIVRISFQFKNESTALYCDPLLNLRQVAPVSAWQPRHCALHVYQPSDVVLCLERMSARRGAKVHFVFMGDSRIRHQFYSFLQFVPEYDVIWKGAPRKMKVQSDMEVEFKLLNLHVSFRWRTLINETVVSEFVKWSTPPLDEAPTLIMVGISAHHMLTMNGADQRIFEGMLKRIEPRIRMISHRTKVIWMNQQPLVEAHNVNKESLVHSKKLELYNQAARRILKDSGAIIWDSGNHLAEEYLRGCSVYSRSDETWYRNCYDYIHTGYVALSRGTQLFLNFLCNKSVRPSSVDPDGQICCVQSDNAKS